LNEYLNKLEAIHRDSLSCLIAQEQKTLSGSGKPAGRVHFHLLMACAINLTATSISDLWQLAEFGGSRTSGAGADVRPYDPNRGAVNYVLKFSKDPAWDWDFRNLELLSPLTPVSAAISSRMRRKLARSGEQRIKAATQSLRLTRFTPTKAVSDPVSLEQ
jgi:hypothetical protein